MTDTTRTGICLLILLFIFNLQMAEADPVVIADPEVARQNEDFQLQGEYAEERRGIQVVALGNDEFEAVIYSGGLPGAGWDKQKPQRIPGNADDMLDLVEDLTKENRQSPSLGKKAPAESTVLFDGTEKTFQEHWKQGARFDAKTGLLQEGATSRDTFQDYSLHLEFRLPFMPEARGQGRGNSGLYHQGRYETQILDSFGLPVKDNECGGLYSIKAPDLNMCLPPLSWQTYDVDFRAARYDETGKLLSNPRMTVKLNGVVIHQDVELPDQTPGGPLGPGPEPGPIFLQNHSNPVRFRNIWVLPVDADQQAKRPIIPGFERFSSTEATQQITNGRLLLGELNCVSCHQANENWKQAVNTKQAPLLTEVGKRIHHEWLDEYLKDPHAVKPGSTMPDLLSGLTEKQRREKLEPIVHFLASTGKTSPFVLDRKATLAGEKLFHSVGCAVCHGVQGEAQVSSPTSVPLGKLHEKYSLPALIEFLKSPHSLRPSGRMPALHLEDKEATNIANFLLRDAKPKATAPNVNFTAYEGRWEELPNWDDLKPTASGKTSGFYIYASNKNTNFGLVFEGWLKLNQDGPYRLWLGSDDGSRLLIDGEEILNSDGIHPHSTEMKTTRLTAGLHEVRVEYFENAGEESLAVEIEGPGLSKQDLGYLLQLTKDSAEPETKESQNASGFKYNPELVGLGKRLFSEVGCANCHELKVNNETLAAHAMAPRLSDLNSERGCLANEVPAALPQYDLNAAQKAALRAALEAGPQTKEITPQQLTHTTMQTFNCYACHKRNSLGGPELSRNELFKTKIPEMGDEGRLPPGLDGVADKLRENWLKKVLKDGAINRPYMQVRMPKFAQPFAEPLAEAWVKADRKEKVSIPEVDGPEYRVKGMGRNLVSNNGLSCIKCHTFADYPATGIQAVSLTSMHERLREDWFQRYLVDPQKYRPGTRMPNVFPNGVSAVRDVYEGQPDEQIKAIWTYLADGKKAGIPAGLLPDPIELVPEQTPIIYRNFIEGLSPRGIAVGYPEHVNLAWDANDLALKKIWHGSFIDAAKHWRGRGPGTQTPLGIHQINFEQVLPLALNSSDNNDWLLVSARDRGFEFQGYRLDSNDRPVFRYTAKNSLSVEESSIPIKKNEKEGDLKRIFQLTPEGEQTVSLVLASGEAVDSLADFEYRIDDALTVHWDMGGLQPAVRSEVHQGTVYLIADFKLTEALELKQTIRW